MGEFRVHFQVTFDVKDEKQLANKLSEIEPLLKRKGTELRTIIFPPEQERKQK